MLNKVVHSNDEIYNCGDDGGGDDDDDEAWYCGSVTLVLPGADVFSIALIG